MTGQHTPGQAPPLRLSISLPGSASLGAYQAGAVSALAVVIDELRSSGREVAVDAVGGVSAGSIVALFLAHSLLTGSDAPEMLRRAWVDDVSVDLLRSRSTKAPLDFTELEGRLRELLGTDPERGQDVDRRRQASPIGLNIGLTNLLGLTYEVRTGGEPIRAMSFVDWGEFHLLPGEGARQLVQPERRSPLDFALASAAHPLAFAPRLLDRSTDRRGYEHRGISNLPRSGSLWYSDGGLVESEPVGRTLAAAHAVAGHAGGVRLHLVIDPRSSGPSGSERWGKDDDLPSWVAGIRRAMSVLPSQALHDDIRDVAAHNHRLEQVDAMVRALEGHLDDADGTLGKNLAGIAGEDPDLTPDASVEQLLRRALQAVAGVTGMERVRIDSISPLKLARDLHHDVPGLLAGDVVGAFGGFLSRKMRESDFALGWDSALKWTEDGFNDLDVDDDTADRVRRAVLARRGPSWQDLNRGDEDVGRLDRRARLHLARLALHVGRIVAAELLPAAIGGRVRRSSRAHDDDGRDPEAGGRHQELEEVRT